MREIDAHFDAYEHLKHLPRESEALHTLRKVASMVKPIMRKRGWKVGTLCEFLPPDPRLQGLNINRSERICLRLRYTPDPRQFIPLDHVIDTMLHELSHIIHGPHDDKFNALWNELRSEYQSLVMKGYTGEGFLSKGRKLGGKRIPLDEMQRQARAAAEKRRTLSKGSGQRLGGTGPPLTSRGGRPDMRQVIADAAARRASITKGCASGTKEGRQIADEAARNGFRTKAEEDDANDMAIAQALAELMEEEEERKLNGLGPAAGIEFGDEAPEGLTWTQERGLQPITVAKDSDRRRSPANEKISSASKPEPELSNARPVENKREHQQSGSANGRPVSRLVLEADSRKPKPPAARSSASTGLSQASATRGSLSARPPSARGEETWTCEICTLDNPATYLCCGACETERPVPGRHDRLTRQGPAAGMSGRQQSLGWNCLRCGSFMENQWWTCSACGTMKVSS